MDIVEIFRRFPKKRFDLPDDYKNIYQIEYLNNRTEIGFINKVKFFLESWMHKQCGRYKGKNILEVGAGTLNHLKYEDGYDTYEVVEPNSFLYENSNEIKKLTKIYKSVFDIELDKCYDKILSVAVMEHLEELPVILSKLAKMLKRDGKLFSAFPTEGGLLWGLTWRISTGLSFFMRYRLNYHVMMSYEHINNFEEILLIHKFFFKKVEVKKFPLSFKHLSLYTVLKVSEPNLLNIGWFDSYEERINSKD